MMPERWIHTIVLVAATISMNACAHSKHNRADSPSHDVKAEQDLDAKLSEFQASVASARADWFKPKRMNAGDAVDEVEGFLTLKGQDRRYRVFFGGLTEAATGKITYLNDDPEVQVNQGFGMAWGWRPFITTNRVTTATDGTKVLVQIDGNIHRIYLLSGGMVEVTTRLANPGCTREIGLLDEPWTYIECTAVKNGGITCYKLSNPPTDVASAPVAIRAFVRDVLKRHRLKQLMDE